MIDIVSAAGWLRRRCHRRARYLATQDTFSKPIFHAPGANGGGDAGNRHVALGVLPAVMTDNPIWDACGTIAVLMPLP